MNGDIGFYTIIPDQLNVANPLLVLILIPFYENVLNPLLAKVRIRNDLQKITLGGVFAGLAFLIAAIVEWHLEQNKYLHMTWLLPQYTLMGMAEIFVTLPLMNFSYTISPKSMKTMVQAFSNLAIGVGNLIVVIVVRLKLFDSQIYEFLLFAGLIFADMILFTFIARRFKRERVEIVK